MRRSTGVGRTPLEAAGRAAAVLAAAGGVVHGAPAVAVLGGLLGLGPPRLAGSRLRTLAGDAVVLTFDDGPSAASTPRTLALLDDLRLRATFFLSGSAVAADPGLALEVARRDHEVASHGMAHVHHLLRSPRFVLDDTEAALGQLAGVGLRARFYRPPYGQVSAATLLAARRAGCEVVLWSGWGREFAEREPGAVLARLERSLRPGAVLLLHDSDAYCPPGTCDLVHAVLPGLADALAARGLRAATLGELVG